MSSRPPLRVAIVGCGLISEQHIRAYRAHADRARIVVCSDIDRTKAEQRAREVSGDVRVVTSLEEVLNDPNVDSIDLLTPHHLHKDGVLAIARAGKHVLCQKPLAKTLDECDAMIDAAARAGIVLWYGETNHTAQSTVVARRTVTEGRVGTVVGIHAYHAHWQGGRYLTTAWRYDPNITGGGQLLDGGIHAIDLMLSLGGAVKSVACFTHRFRAELGGEDTASVSLQFEAGHVGTLLTSQSSAMWPPGPSLTLLGTEGILTVGEDDAAVVLYRNDLPGKRQVLLNEGRDDFATMVGKFLDSVLDGAPIASPPQVGRENLRIVLAAYESARTGRAVHTTGGFRP